MAAHIDLINQEKSFTHQASLLYKLPNFGRLDRNTLVQHIHTILDDNSNHISEKTIKKYKFELAKEKTAVQVQKWLSYKILAGSKMAVI